MSSHDWRRADGSKPVVGSSRKTSSGSPAIPSARSSRRRWPPDRAAARASWRAPRPPRAVPEPHEVEHLVGRARRGVGGGVELDDLARGERAVDALLLQDDPDARAERALALGRVVAEDRDLAGVAGAVALEDLDEGCLA